MDEDTQGRPSEAASGDLETVVRRVIEEYRQREQSKTEPAYKAELHEERRRREALEKRVNELIAENERARTQAEQAERSAGIRAELQRAGVQKVDLAYKVIQDAVVKGEDGKLLARAEGGEVPLRDYVADFLRANPEFLPARIPGGSGTGPGNRAPASGGSVDLEKIRPGMSREEMEKARLEILRVASQTLRGQ
jgi:hypothetical protein